MPRRRKCFLMFPWTEIARDSVSLPSAPSLDSAARAEDGDFSSLMVDIKVDTGRMRVGVVQSIAGRLAPVVWTSLCGVTRVPNVYRFGQRTPSAAVVGLLIVAGAALYWLGQKTEYSVLLTTASGEAKALTSDDGAFISKVVSALNHSIVHRG